MGIFFEPFAADRCCLCGSREKLTGEHKIKASALRAIFGTEAMAIGHFDGESEPRSAQGPKSNKFHFEAPLCSACNSSRTQAADREFDRFHRAMSENLAAGHDPATVFDLERYAVESDSYLNVFRYFAKLLCCHLAESGGPRSIQIGQFAIGATRVNPIKLRIDADPTYHDFAALSGEHQFAAHGGLVVMANRQTELMDGFLTSLTLGPVRYVFWVEFGVAIALAIKLFHKPFADKCEAAYRDALINPISPEKRRKLGL
jgi:hypothetical protein